jgi:hypothetical protein
MQLDPDMIDALRADLAAVLLLVEELVLHPPTTEELSFLGSS